MNKKILTNVNERMSEFRHLCFNATKQKLYDLDDRLYMSKNDMICMGLELLSHLDTNSIKSLFEDIQRKLYSNIEMNGIHYYCLRAMSLYSIPKPAGLYYKSNGEFCVLVFSEDSVTELRPTQLNRDFLVSIKIEFDLFEYNHKLTIDNFNLQNALLHALFNINMEDVHKYKLEFRNQDYSDISQTNLCVGIKANKNLGYNFTMTFETASELIRLLKEAREITTKELIYKLNVKLQYHTPISYQVMIQFLSQLSSYIQIKRELIEHKIIESLEDIYDLYKDKVIINHIHYTEVEKLAFKTFTNEYESFSEFIQDYPNLAFYSNLFYKLRREKFKNK